MCEVIAFKPRPSTGQKALITVTQIISFATRRVTLPDIQPSPLDRFAADDSIARTYRSMFRNAFGYECGLPDRRIVLCYNAAEHLGDDAILNDMASYSPNS